MFQVSLPPSIRQQGAEFAGVPYHIRSDNGPEFVAKTIQRWLNQLNIEALYIAPGSHWENGYAESFHSRVRDEFLALDEFENLPMARRLTIAWKTEYNKQRPHRSLGYVTPAEFSARWWGRASDRPTASLQQPPTGSHLTQPVLS